MTALKTTPDRPRRPGLMTSLWMLLALALPVLACSAGGGSSLGGTNPGLSTSLPGATNTPIPVNPSATVSPTRAPTATRTRTAIPTATRTRTAIPTATPTPTPPPLLLLNRYFCGAAKGCHPPYGDHHVTVHAIDRDYWDFEASLGNLIGGGGSPRPGTRMLYRCFFAEDYFVSLDANCDGASVVGGEGYIYQQPSDPDFPSMKFKPLYRCVTTGGWDHFASFYSNCEGTITEGLLGYVVMSL
jgi:hypothetical protein